MPLDANIILQGRMPQIDLMDIHQKGLNMRQLSMQNQKMEREAADSASMSDILKRNVMTDASGKSSLNQGSALSEMYKVNPERAMAFKKMIDTYGLDEMKNISEKSKQLAWSVTPENYRQVKQRGIEMGLPNFEMLPEEYMPAKVEEWKIATLDGEKQVDLALKEKHYRNEEENRKLDRNLKYDERNQKRIERQEALALKALEKEEKKKQVFNEIEDRRQNITAALSTAISKIQEDGTWEISGPHNQNLDRLIDGIATDMAKLQDPTSVARPSEVEQIKKTLVESGFSNRNSTAQEILKTFKTEIDRRADLAYKVRGYEKPSSSPDINQSTNSIKPPWAK